MQSLSKREDKMDDHVSMLERGIAKRSWFLELQTFEMRGYLQ